MREILQQLLEKELPQHLGLAYDVWAPVSVQGTIDEAKRDEWLDKLNGFQAPSDYKYFYQNWEQLAKLQHFRVQQITMASRLLVGHGNASPTEVGLTVHHTWGVPVIPGSALKGLLNHYVDCMFGPSWVSRNHHPMDPNHPEKERAPYAGVQWEGTKIKMGPGAIHKALFGAPDAEMDENYNTGASRGLVTFYDALWVPGTPGMTPFARDILTPHQKSYYDTKSQTEPNDYDPPNPVAFLTVRPKASFLLCLSGPEDWTELAMELLLDALEEWGIGAKTSAGYGHFYRQGTSAGTAVVGTTRTATPSAPAPQVQTEKIAGTIYYDKGKKTVSFGFTSRLTPKSKTEAKLDQLLQQQKIPVELAEKLKKNCEVKAHVTLRIDGNNVQIDRVDP